MRCMRRGVAFFATPLRREGIDDDVKARDLATM